MSGPRSPQLDRFFAQERLRRSPTMTVTMYPVETALRQPDLHHHPAGHGSRPPPRHGRAVARLGACQPRRASHHRPRRHPGTTQRRHRRTGSSDLAAAHREMGTADQRPGDDLASRPPAGGLDDPPQPRGCSRWRDAVRSAVGSRLRRQSRRVCCPRSTPKTAPGRVPSWRPTLLPSWRIPRASRARRRRPAHARPGDRSHQYGQWAQVHCPTTRCFRHRRRRLNGPAGHSARHPLPTAEEKQSRIDGVILGKICSHDRVGYAAAAEHR
jgi:hypothetical protein